MNDEKTNKIMSSEELDGVLPKYEPIKLSGKNLAQNYVSAFNTGMNIYQCVNYLQGNIDWTIKAVNDVVKSWNTEVSESIDHSKAIVRETTTEQFNTEWTNKQPELIEQVNTLTTNQFNNEKSIFNDKLDALDARIDNEKSILNDKLDVLDARTDTFSNPNLLINSDFKINQRGKSTYSSTGAGGTVDRWVGTNVKTDVNSDGTVTVSSLSGVGYYTQHEESISYGKHTYSIYVQAITGTVTTFYKSKDSNDTVLGTLKQGLNTFTSSDDGFKSFFLSIAGGSFVTLKYAKVEQGTVATSYIAPNPVEEHPKCQRYFQYIHKLYCVPLVYERSNINSLDKYFQTTNGNLVTEMRITPTLTYKTLSQNDSSTFTGSVSFELTSKSIDAVTIDQAITNFTITINDITLDAEIY